MKTTVAAIASFLVVLLTINVNTGFAQAKKPAKATIIKNLIDNQQYVFYAQYVTPMRGQQRFLTSEYTVNVVKDTVQCDLPYFGQAYSAPINPSDNGLRFTTTNFNYTVEERKKGGWDITIKPKDMQDVQTLNFTVFGNGTASLNVMSTNRQPIYFSGYISEKKLNK